MLSSLALVLFFRPDSPEALLKRMQDAVSAANREQVTALFEKSDESGYLFRMAERAGGLNGLKVAVFPTPKGWGADGSYWAMFHAWQELEQDHDPIYAVVSTSEGLKLGKEIPEWDCGAKLVKVSARVELDPHRENKMMPGPAAIYAAISYSDAKPGRALLFRLNDGYRTVNVDSRMDGYSQTATLPNVTELNEKLVEKPAGDFRVGSLLTYTPTETSGTVPYAYFCFITEGAKYSDDRDQVLEDHAYLTSYWLPTLGRQPAPTMIKISAPKDWVVRSEGELIHTGSDYMPGMSETVFKCDVPISYPKVIAGKYVLALEGEQNGHKLRSYQFAPVDKERAAKDVEWMKKAMVFYEKNLGPFPFKSYECFDGKDYYGIESYSYTVLAPTITTWAVSHEMGHTYFGGLAPCGYLKDSWNEGITQYVDDSLLHESKQVIENAFSGINISVPLTEMPVAWEYEGATYWRGGFAMHMMDGEIGHDKVMGALRSIVKDRVGKETTWLDLRQYFEKESGQDLKWFWDQWISSGVFPKVAITSAVARYEAGKWITSVAVKQSGTRFPFRLRFSVRVSGEAPVDEPQVLMRSEDTFEVKTSFKPIQAAIDPGTTALIHVDPPVQVSAG